MEEIKRDTALNIYQRMAAITADLNTVGKNLHVDTGKGKGYKAVSERDIIDNVKPLEAKYGVYSYPASRTVLESERLESETNYNGVTGKKTTFFERVETVYRFVNIDNPDEYIETTTFAEGIDAQDKGSGKAMTYADKYALMKMYKISTGDDPDADPSNDEYYRKPTDRKPPTQAAAKPVSLRCEKCGSIIEDFTKESGKKVSALSIAMLTKKETGKCLCKSCMTAWRESGTTNEDK